MITISQYFRFIAGFFLVFCISCSKESTNNNTTSTNTGTNKSITGYAQKGPFLNGSSVTISELDPSFVPTGNTFNTQIIDNSGLFNITATGLASNYITGRVDGFYFNEVCGLGSKSQITLNAIIDVSSNSNLNINTLTHIEKARVEYLISSGISFNNAKSQAQTEILNIFNISPTNPINSSELLDLSKGTEGDAILIAISSILQGYRSESEFSNLMANIITDIRTDGILNSTSIASELKTTAKFLDTNKIKQNIIDRYSSLGLSASVPSFGYLISNFVNSSTAAVKSVYDYPSSGTFGDNILDLNKTNYNANQQYSMKAILPAECLSLKIGIKSSTSVSGSWGFNASSEWAHTIFNSTKKEQFFTATGLNCNLDFHFFGAGTYIIEYYENENTNPTRSKTIIFN